MIIGRSFALNEARKRPDNVRTQFPDFRGLSLLHKGVSMQRADSSMCIIQVYTREVETPDVNANSKLGDRPSIGKALDSAFSTFDGRRTTSSGQILSVSGRA